MRGTGTQQDPFVVDNWADFITAVGTSGAYVEFPKILTKTNDRQIIEGKLYVDSAGDTIVHPVPSGLSNYYENNFTLDQNDYYPEGLTSDINIVCNSLNGNGGKITNIYFATNNKFNATGSGSYPTIKNVNFHNILSRYNDTFMAFTGKLEKNMFSVKSEMGSHNFLFANQYEGDRIIKNCSIYYQNQTISSTNYVMRSNYGGVNFQYNRVILNTPNAVNSQIEKQSYLLVQGETGYLTVESPSYSVIDCTVNTNASITSATQCLINSDKVSGTITGGTSVTSEQMLNADYLASIGFPIQT